MVRNNRDDLETKRERLLVREKILRTAEEAFEKKRQDFKRMAKADAWVEARAEVRTEVKERTEVTVSK